MRIGPFFFLLLPSCSDADPSAIEREVTAVLEAQVAAWNRGDVDGYMAGYAESEDIVFTSGAKIRRGFRTTRDHFLRRYADHPERMGRLRFQDLEVHPLGPDAAWVLGRWRLEGAEGSPGGVFTLVVARRPEGFRVVMDHTSLEPPQERERAD